MKGECELRCKIDELNPLSVKLLTGSAEIFGIELTRNKEFIFREGSIAIFSWYGCKVETTGSSDTIIHLTEPGETPMVAYVNTHSQIEARRDDALASGENGPRVLIVGPTDCGKSTLSRILTAYAARLIHC